MICEQNILCTRIAKNKNANQIEGGLRSLPHAFQFQHPAYPIFWNTEIRLENQHKECHVLRHVKVSGWTFDLVKRKKISRHFLHSFSKKMVFFHHFIEQYSTRGSFKNRFLKSIKPHDLGSILSTSYFSVLLQMVSTLSSSTLKILIIWI